MFGIGGWELAILFLFGFLIFGPDKMPQIARTIGRAVRQFRSAQEQMNKVIKAEVYDPLKDIEPLTNPFAGFSLDDTKKDAGKKAAEKKSSDKSTDKTVSDTKAVSDTEDTGDGSEKQAAKDKKADKPKVTGDAMQAAIASDAEKARKAAVEQTSKKAAAASTTTESFAQRRARLEKEHAQTKTVKQDEGTETPSAANPGPITETKEDSTAVKPADVVVSSDTGEEEERG